MNALRLGAHTFGLVWEHTVFESIALLADRGFRSIEILSTPGHLDIWADVSEIAERMSRALAGRDAKIFAFDLPAHDFNLASLDDRVIDFSISAYERLIELAGAVGAPWVTLHGGRRIGFYPPPDVLPFEALRRSVDRLVTIAQRNGVRLLIENIVPALLNTAKSMSEFVAEGGWEDVSFIYDVANAAPLGEDAGEALRCLSSRLEVVHVSDCPAGMHRHAPIGSGAIDFQRLWTLLESHGFRGDVVLEIGSTRPVDDAVAGKERLVELGWKFA